jgi:hypothetical protein
MQPVRAGPRYHKETPGSLRFRALSFWGLRQAVTLATDSWEHVVGST